jgi:hypothetical protein
VTSCSSTMARMRRRAWTAPTSRWYKRPASPQGHGAPAVGDVVAEAEVDQQRIGRSALPPVADSGPGTAVTHLAKGSWDGLRSGARPHRYESRRVECMPYTCRSAVAGAEQAGVASMS